MTDAERAREIAGKAGMEQCWCDLIHEEAGCPTCRAESLILDAIAAARAEERERCAAQMDELARKTTEMYRDLSPDLRSIGSIRVETLQGAGSAIRRSGR